MNEDNKNRLLTLTAFTIGFIFTEKFTSTEQNAIGGFFMLIGQTLCTSGSENFRRDWKNTSNPTNQDASQTNQEMSKEDFVRILKNARDVFNDEISKFD